MSVTHVPYMYRDANNYKAHHTVRLAGQITDEQRERVRQSLESIVGDHTGFIPEQIGWPHAGDGEGSWTSFPNPNDDHCWHELDVDEIEVSGTWAGVLPTETVEQWVAAMVEAAERGWDDTTHGARFEG
jgi:hypothetical protein